MKCNICSSESSFLGAAVLLNKYKVQYFRCGTCGMIQTENPYWLNEAYCETITRSDVGLVSRNITFSRLSAALLCIFFDKRAKFLDYAGGYGLFVRLMRDAGFEFYWHDKFCPNLFARDLEARDLHGDKYELITAIEVFEHLTNPMDEISEMFRISKNILFSTELVPPSFPKPGEWWYYGPEHGQHISFYTEASLSVIADKFGVNFCTNRASLHLFSAKRISPFLFRLVSDPRLATLVKRLGGRRSLLERDYWDAVKRLGYSNKEGLQI